MQYNYVECELPSNGKIYPTRVVHLRPKTIFDIKSLLQNPVYMIKSEIDTLQHCLSPQDRVNVYDLVNQDVVYLLYKLRSLSDDILTLSIKNQTYDVKISDLEVKYLDNWDNEITLPESKLVVKLNYRPIYMIFNAEIERDKFLKKYPDYPGDALNAVNLINSISSIGDKVTPDVIRLTLETLSWKDSIYLLDAIDKINSTDTFGIVEEVTLNIEGEDVKIPLQITEEFFRPALKNQ